MKKSQMIWLAAGVVAVILIYNHNKKKTTSVAAAPAPPETVSFAGNEMEYQRAFRN
jgi:hypothetical protein